MPRWFGALTVFGSIQPCRMVKNGPKKSAPECPVECGGGSNCYLGNAQIRPNNLEVFPYAQSEQMVAEAALNTRGGADGNTQEVASNQR